MALAQDLRFGVRLLKSSPASTAVAVLTLALGVASTTTVYSWIESLLFNPVPGAAHRERLAIIEPVANTGPTGNTLLSYVEMSDYRRGLKGVSGIAAHRDDIFTVGEGMGSQGVWGELVSGNYFEVLGIQPAIGQFFGSVDDASVGAQPMAVISDGLWRTMFRADPAIAGKTVRINRHVLTIAGVTPPAFRGTSPGLSMSIWIPVSMGPELGVIQISALRDRGHRNLFTFVRLKDGVTLAQASAETAAVAGTLARLYPQTNRGVSMEIRPWWKSRNGAIDMLRGPLQILMATAILVLLIACANVVNLLLARSVARQKEFSIRLAMGAGRRRLVQQMLTETTILAISSGIIAIPIAMWMTDGLQWLIPSAGVPVALSMTLNFHVLGFLVLLCGFAALASGTVPALLTARTDVNERLKAGGRTGTSGRHSHQTRAALVIAEIALAAVALVGAALFARSFQQARSIYPGFDAKNVLVSRLWMASGGYKAEEIQSLCARLRDRLMDTPGIAAASYADDAPLSSPAGRWTTVSVDGYAPAPGEDLRVNFSSVSPGYFGLLNIPLLEGRDLRVSDGRDSARVAIVNQTFARRFFHGASPVGRKLSMWDREWDIVGMVRDGKYFRPSEAPLPFYYVPFEQAYGIGNRIDFFVRTPGDPVRAAAAVRRAAVALDPGAGAMHSVPLEEYTQLGLLPNRIAAGVLAGLGLLSLILATVGLYSVMAYAVGQKTREIGIRMALGARPGDVLGGVLRQGMILVCAGLTIGIALSLAVTRSVSAMLIRVESTDGIAFGGAALILTVVAAAATLIPARRATKGDPIVALRWE